MSSDLINNDSTKLYTCQKNNVSANIEIRDKPSKKPIQANLLIPNLKKPEWLDYLPKHSHIAPVSQRLSYIDNMNSQYSENDSKREKTEAKINDFLLYKANPRCKNLFLKIPVYARVPEEHYRYHSTNIAIYKNDIKISSKKMYPKAKKFGVKGNKEKIHEFSKKSRKELKFKLANLSHTFINFITLTYPQNFITDGKETKRHLKNFTQWLREKKIKYVWILEFQKNGSPHYHLLVDTFIDMYELKAIWYWIVDSGNENHLEQGTKIERIRNLDNGKAYMYSYINKMEQKEVPPGYENVGRFYGMSRGICEPELVLKRDGLINETRKDMKFIRNWYENKLKRKHNKKIKIKPLKNFIFWGGTCLTKYILDKIAFQRNWKIYSY